MGKKSSPKAPDLTALAASSEKQAQLNYQTSQEQLTWAKEQWTQIQDMLGPTLDIQKKVMEENYNAAVEDRARYKDKFQPIEDQLVEEFKSYASPERIKQEEGKAQSQVRMALDTQRENAQQSLQSFGIDPSQVHAYALDRNARVAEAASVAAAGNVARKTTEDTGRALRAEALNIGHGYPSQVAQSYGTSLSAGNSAIANVTGATSTGANTQGTALQWGAAGAANTGQAANIYSTNFQNKLQAAQFAYQSSPLTALGGIAGQALGIYSGMKMAAA